MSLKVLPTCSMSLCAICRRLNLRKGLVTLSILGVKDRILQRGTSPKTKRLHEGDLLSRAVLSGFIVQYDNNHLLRIEYCDAGPFRGTPF